MRVRKETKKSHTFTYRLPCSHHRIFTYNLAFEISMIFWRSFCVGAGVVVGWEPSKVNWTQTRLNQQTERKKRKRGPFLVFPHPFEPSNLHKVCGLVTSILASYDMIALFHPALPTANRVLIPGSATCFCRVCRVYLYLWFRFLCSYVFVYCPRKWRWRVLRMFVYLSFSLFQVVFCGWYSRFL